MPTATVPKTRHSIPPILYEWWGRHTQNAYMGNHSYKINGGVSPIEAGGVGGAGKSVLAARVGVEVVPRGHLGPDELVVEYGVVIEIAVGPIGGASLGELGVEVDDALADAGAAVHVG